MDLSGHYVYEHWKDGKCYYVGKGQRDRALLILEITMDGLKCFQVLKNGTKIVLISSK